MPPPGRVHAGRSTAESELVLVASASPDGAAEARGIDLGALVMASGNPQDLAAAIRAGGRMDRCAR